MRCDECNALSAQVAAAEIAMRFVFVICLVGGFQFAAVA